MQNNSARKCTFCGWCFKNKGYYIFKCWDFVVVCPPIKISGYVPAIGPPGDLNLFFRRL